MKRREQRACVDSEAEQLKTVKTENPHGFPGASPSHNENKARRKPSKKRKRRLLASLIYSLEVFFTVARLWMGRARKQTNTQEEEEEKSPAWFAPLRCAALRAARRLAVT